uniref:Uncharacterized protein n=1 Tax=Ciona savignyi TaxID=51511 RepID=H2YF99_CIOSA
MSVYLLLSLFGTIQVTFTLVHAAFLPRIPAKFDGPARTKKCKTAQAEIEKDELVKDSTDPNKTIKLRKAMVSELKETFRHMISPLHVLIFPLIFYYGAFLAFVVTEFTRAYISCAI